MLLLGVGVRPSLDDETIGIYFVTAMREVCSHLVQSRLSLNDCTGNELTILGECKRPLGISLYTWLYWAR